MEQQTAICFPVLIFVVNSESLYLSFMHIHTLMNLSCRVNGEYMSIINLIKKTQTKHEKKFLVLVLKGPLSFV